MESFEFIKAFFSAVSGTLTFLICLFAVLVAFTVCVVLSAVKSGYGFRKRVWYVVFAAFFCVFLRARAYFTGEADFSSVLTCFSLALLMPVCFIPEKKDVGAGLREGDDRRKFVRMLDEKLHSARDCSENADFHTEEIKAEIPPAATPQRREDAQDLDFSHVKNVLARLEPSLLSYADRRQIHDLESALFDAERGAYSDETRSKINEGLGNLLKIMAKHGV
nr:hypothetical protein [Clostridia bacterium]